MSKSQSKTPALFVIFLVGLGMAPTQWPGISGKIHTFRYNRAKNRQELTAETADDFNELCSDVLHSAWPQPGTTFQIELLSAEALENEEEARLARNKAREDLVKQKAAAERATAKARAAAEKAKAAELAAKGQVPLVGTASSEPLTPKSTSLDGQPPADPEPAFASKAAEDAAEGITPVDLLKFGKPTASGGKFGKGDVVDAIEARDKAEAEDSDPQEPEPDKGDDPEPEEGDDPEPEEGDDPELKSSPKTEEELAADPPKDDFAEDLKAEAAEAAAETQVEFASGAAEQAALDLSFVELLEFGTPTASGGTKFGKGDVVAALAARDAAEAAAE